jgi:hypothetical protein
MAVEQYHTAQLACGIPGLPPVKAPVYYQKIQLCAHHEQFEASLVSLLQQLQSALTASMCTAAPGWLECLQPMT